MTITKSEVEVLQTLWRENRPLSKKSILAMTPDKSWKDSSVHQLINHMLEKDLIQVDGMERSGKVYGRRFSPVISEHDYYANIIAEAAPRTSMYAILKALKTVKGIDGEATKELQRILAELQRPVSHPS